MINQLKNLFPKVPTLALSPSMTSNVLEYICKLLKLYLPVWLYEKLLDHLNIIYIIAEIRKPKFEELSFVISLMATIFSIPKTIIFNNNTDIVGQIADYLWTCFLSKLQSINHIFIQTLSPNI